MPSTYRVIETVASRRANRRGADLWCEQPLVADRRTMLRYQTGHASALATRFMSSRPIVWGSRRATMRRLDGLSPGTHRGHGAATPWAVTRARNRSQSYSVGPPLLQGVKQKSAGVSLRMLRKYRP